jgi:CRP-like cAMP-binding protein
MEHNGGFFMDIILNDKELDSLNSCPLFENISTKDTRENILNMGCFKRNYLKKSILLDFDHDFKGIGILLSGEITVNIFYENGNHLPLRCIRPSEVFGLSYFLNNDSHEIITFITNTDSTVLFINEDCLLTLLKNSPILLQNYLNYMNGRIKFLISKIVFFNLSNNKQKICHFLLNECSKTSSRDCCLNLPKSTLCEYLGIGRTSFYRELNALADNSAIEVKNNGVITIDSKKLIDILNNRCS